MKWIELEDKFFRMRVVLILVVCGILESIDVQVERQQNLESSRELKRLTSVNSSFEVYFEFQFESELIHE